MTIRRVTRADIPFVLDVARARFPAANMRDAAMWLEQVIASPDMIALRGDMGIAIAALSRAFWSPVRAHLIFLIAKRAHGLSRASFREGVELMRTLDHWRQVNGAASFHFGEDTGVNFAVLAKALGARKDRPSYTLGSTELSFAADMFAQGSKSEDVAQNHTRTALEQVLGRVM